MSKDTTGPAFPQHFEFGKVGDCTDMTLRDWFAATASEDDILFMLGRAGFGEVRSRHPLNSRQIARYLHADAMLEARAK